MAPGLVHRRVASRTLCRSVGWEETQVPAYIYAEAPNLYLANSHIGFETGQPGLGQKSREEKEDSRGHSERLSRLSNPKILITKSIPTSGG